MYSASVPNLGDLAAGAATCPSLLPGASDCQLLWLLRLLLPCRAGGYAAGHARRLLLPGHSLLDRQLPDWPGNPLLLYGTGLRPPQLVVLVESFTPALRRCGRLLPLALLLPLAPAALFLGAVAVPAA
jgi:hypothetical protein